jgi:MFS family permease
MSSFMGGRMVTSLCCGHISDKFGRKVVILIGLWSCLVLQLVFGFATTFWQAVAARFLMGAFNGIIAAAKTMCAELVAPAKQAGAMSAIAGTWGVGMVLGTALGGVLAEPADTFSFVSADGLLGRHPYALPNIVGSLIAAMAIVFVSKFLPETVAVQPWRWPRPCCFCAVVAGARVRGMLTWVAAAWPAVPWGSPRWARRSRCAAATSSL